MINGSGRYEAEHLVSDFAQVTVNGSGQVGVSVTDELNVSIEGSGQVTYAGFPDIAKTISGTGSLTRRRRSVINSILYILAEQKSGRNFQG